MRTDFFRPEQTGIEQADATPQLPEVKDLGTLCSPEVQIQALEARAAVLKLINQLATAPMKYRDERLRIARERVATDYLGAINVIRGQASRAELRRLQTTLTTRLSAGYAKKANPTRDALWSRLLSEYEIVTDALAENAMWRFTDRLQDIEARWH